MKALVLGGNGFIGSHVVDQLLAHGHSVCVFDRSLEKYRGPLPQVDYRLAQFDDVAALAESLHGIDVVYHLISTTVPSTSNKDPIYDVESNLVWTLRLLNLMREFAVDRIVYLSSGGTVYGVPEVLPIPESHPLRPICSYGVVKVAIENYIRMFNKLYGLEYIIIRPSNPYGERQGHSGVQGLIGTMMRRLLRNEAVEIWGDGSIVRDFIYVRDLAELCVIAGCSQIVGTFNAGSGEGISVKEVFDVLVKISEKAVVPVYKTGRAYDVPKVVLSFDKAREQFSWEPSIRFEDGLQSTWAWHLEVAGKKINDSAIDAR
ncbi:NAD-dependent epimerase/dehydratase family protein [Candidatus Parcubacteria bacterium]|nr:MAG: NAD-dependent epimerase/dehydratase family protein [Candidatus Parcubacteria bacterium]